MHIRFRELWLWEGTTQRGPYALVGTVGFAIKHNLDRILATWVFHRPWDLFNYWIPLGRAVHLSALSTSEAQFLAAMVGLSLPFIWVGVVLTLRRCRDAGLPTWLILLFFFPVLNLLFFLILCLLPTRAAAPEPPAGRRPRYLDRLVPESAFGSAAVAVLLTVLFGLAVTLGSTRLLASYGWGLFVALPFCLGLSAVLLYGHRRPRGFGKCIGMACLSVGVLGLAMLAVAAEGAVCILMAAPLGLALAIMGGSLGYVIQRHRWCRPERTLLPAVLLFAPAFLFFEHWVAAAPPVFAVTTAIEVNAPPETVWHNVISFDEITEPPEWIFRLGVACPVRAEIQGAGRGAVRHCVFSTGEFLEPIEVWEEPRRLRFSVISNPAPMREWSPYSRTEPPHLQGFLVANAGEFRLTPLPGHWTRLEGTTWYRHTLWPSEYWCLWSDTIIHRIHLRVLHHIALEAEKESSLGGAGSGNPHQCETAEPAPLSNTLR